MTCSEVNTQNVMQIFCVINSEEVGASFCICHALSTNCQIFNEVCKVLHDGELKNCLQTIHKGTHYCVMANCCSLQQIFQSSTLCVTQEGQTLASNSNFLFVSYFVLWCWVVPHPLRISNPPWTVERKSTQYRVLVPVLRFGTVRCPIRDVLLCTKRTTKAQQQIDRMRDYRLQYRYRYLLLHKYSTCTI